jgi:hypothetical protein
MKHPIRPITALLLALASTLQAAPPPQTTVSIVKDDFHINGQPTYAGRAWNGHRIEGLLMNSRMVQATYDDFEVNNETDVKAYDHDILKPARVHELIERVRKAERNGRRLLVGTSYGGGGIPKENVVRHSDFLLLHGNGIKDPAGITRMIRETRRVPGFRPMPILINEDDHENFDQPANNFSEAIAEHVSWGWFDFRRKGEGHEQGYQSPPVNWGISSPRKRAFFDYLKTITNSEHRTNEVPSNHRP